MIVPFQNTRSQGNCTTASFNGEQSNHGQDRLLNKRKITKSKLQKRNRLFVAIRHYSNLGMNIVGLGKLNQKLNRQFYAAPDRGTYPIC